MQQQSGVGIAPMPGPEAKANAQLRESALKEEMNPNRNAPRLLEESTMTSPKGLARIAGVLYLLVFISGVFAQGLVLPKMYVAGDAAS